MAIPRLASALALALLFVAAGRLQASTLETFRDNKQVVLSGLLKGNGVGNFKSASIAGVKASFRLVEKQTAVQLEANSIEDIADFDNVGENAIRVSQKNRMTVGVVSKVNGELVLFKEIFAREDLGPQLKLLSDAYVSSGPSGGSYFQVLANSATNKVEIVRSRSSQDKSTVSVDIRKARIAEIVIDEQNSNSVYTVVAGEDAEAKAHLFLVTFPVQSEAIDPQVFKLQELAKPECGFDLDWIQAGKSFTLEELCAEAESGTIRQFELAKQSAGEWKVSVKKEHAVASSRFQSLTCGSEIFVRDYVKNELYSLDVDSAERLDYPLKDFGILELTSGHCKQDVLVQIMGSDKDKKSKIALFRVRAARASKDEWLHSLVQVDGVALAFTSVPSQYYRGSSEPDQLLLAVLRDKSLTKANLEFHEVSISGPHVTLDFAGVAADTESFNVDLEYTVYPATPKKSTLEVKLLSTASLKPTIAKTDSAHSLGAESYSLSNLVKIRGVASDVRLEKADKLTVEQGLKEDATYFNSDWQLSSSVAAGSYLFGLGANGLALYDAKTKKNLIESPAGCAFSDPRTVRNLGEKDAPVFYCLCEHKDRVMSSQSIVLVAPDASGRFAVSLVGLQRRSLASLRLSKFSDDAYVVTAVDRVPNPDQVMAGYLRLKGQEASLVSASNFFVSQSAIGSLTDSLLFKGYLAVFVSDRYSSSMNVLKLRVDGERILQAGPSQAISFPGLDRYHENAQLTCTVESSGTVTCVVPGSQFSSYLLTYKFNVKDSSFSLADYSAKPIQALPGMEYLAADLSGGLLVLAAKNVKTGLTKGVFAFDYLLQVHTVSNLDSPFRLLGANDQPFRPTLFRHHTSGALLLYPGAPVDGKLKVFETNQPMLKFAASRELPEGAAIVLLDALGEEASKITLREVFAEASSPGRNTFIIILCVVGILGATVWLVIYFLFVRRKQAVYDIEAMDTEYFSMMNSSATKSKIANDMV